MNLQITILLWLGLLTSTPGGLPAETLHQAEARNGSTPADPDGCEDADGDGVLECFGDCDDSNPHCTFNCTDADGDGYCVGFGCDDANGSCTLDCTDSDGDLFCDDGDNCPDLPNPGQGDVDGPSSWWEYVLGNDFVGAALLAADVDGDQDPDFLRDLAGNLVWHENTDGAGTFGPPTPVGFGALFTSTVAAADIDDDQDADLVVLYFPDDCKWCVSLYLAVYRNLDGVGGSWQRSIVDTNFRGETFSSSTSTRTGMGISLVDSAQWERRGRFGGTKT